MEYPTSPLDSSFGPLLDFDFELFPDEMLLGGAVSALLQASDHSESFEHRHGASNPLDCFDSSLFSSNSEIATISNTLQEDQLELHLNNTLPGASSRYPIDISTSSDQDWSLMVAGESGMSGHGDPASLSNSTEQTRYSGGRVSSLKQRLMKALRNIKDESSEGDVLVQIWVPVKRGDAHVLTTCGQPFALNPGSRRLMQYRTASVNYFFPTEADTKMAVGLPGRVFLGQLPEWTPDVQYYNSNEYPRVGHAYRYEVHGTLAVPVFEQGSRSCLGVVEVVMTTHKINFAPEVDKICEALQAVNLRSSDVLSMPFLKVSPTDSSAVCNEGYQAAIPEILEVLEKACETHKLPLALTWIPCIQQGKMGSRHSDDNYKNCISTIDAACYATDPHFRAFQEACSQHHLMKGEGIAGKAFTTNQPCFSADVTVMNRAEYPLVHYAKFFGLRAAVAIRLRSLYTTNIDYALEFFLPVNCIDTEEQRNTLNSLSLTVQRVCRGLRVLMDEELECEARLKVCSADVVEPDSGRQMDMEKSSVFEVAGTNQCSGLGQSSSNKVLQASMRGEVVWLPAYKSVEVCKPQKEASGAASGHLLGLHEGAQFTGTQKHNLDSETNSVGNATSSMGDATSLCVSKRHEKRRIKTEKTISLKILQQYFAGSLKDAAKSLGVCPTTLKRICRQYGITRWPSRKIKKVDHSIKKLQVVIDSVQAASGNFKMSLFYDNLPEAHGSRMTNKSLSSSGKLSSMNQVTEKTSSTMPASTPIFQVTSKSTSCSQSSSSGHSYSSCAEPLVHTGDLGTNEDTCTTGNLNAMIKRAHSELVLPAVSPEPKLISHSQKYVTEQPLADCPPSLPKSGDISVENCLIRVKVLFGEEIIRFRIQPTLLFLDLREEIGRRFHVENIHSIDLKYLDDDSEWVLLTSDDDLRECMDIYRSSNARAIKLSVHYSCLPVTNT